jgi:5-oxoprolinase (ATP-hydrolysing)
LGAEWTRYDVIVSNHPQAGGSHLPDITVISPVWDKEANEGGKPIFYVASRGHHADIGGLTPGSMPPFSKSLKDEGIAIKSFKIVDNRHFQETQLLQILQGKVIYFKS